MIQLICDLCNPHRSCPLPSPIQYLSISAEKQLKYHASQLEAPICVSDMQKRAICLNPKKQDIIEPKINFYKD